MNCAGRRKTATGIAAQTVDDEMVTTLRNGNGK